MTGLDAMTPFEAALVNRLCAERDQARADLTEARAALGRVEALCDKYTWTEADRGEIIIALRAALGVHEGETP